MLTSNYKRILRNTGMLYIRMLLAMAVGLYTTRVLLNVLGVEDFGIYFVVAGFVALLGFMQGALTTASQRYFAFDLGQNSGQNLRELFNTSLQVHALLAICIVLISETAGYWFVSTRLTIPEGRLEAALLAYHLSVASFDVTIMTVPLTAMLMANERMGLFALMSMADILLKLLAVLLLPYLGYDHLSTYAALLLGVSLLTFCGYLLINRTIFPAVRLQWSYDKKDFRSMLGFTAWNTWGNLAGAISLHGNNILLNIFFGPVVNSARTIAVQANGALSQFVTNVQAAINPQIIKLYASGEREQMHSLVQRASKYNFFILLALALPVLFYTEEMLEMWLVQPPDFSEMFLRITIVVSLIDSVSRPLMTSAQAAGKIRLYQGMVGGVLLLNLPLAYIFIELWHDPVVAMLSSIVAAMLALMARLVILRRLTGLVLKCYFDKVIVRVFLAGVIAASLNYFFVFSEFNGRFFFFGVAISFFVTAIAVFFFGLDREERKYTLFFFRWFLERFKHLGKA